MSYVCLAIVILIVTEDECIRIERAAWVGCRIVTIHWRCDCSTWTTFESGKCTLCAWRVECECIVNRKKWDEHTIHTLNLPPAQCGRPQKNYDKSLSTYHGTFHWSAVTICDIFRVGSAWLLRWHFAAEEIGMTAVPNNVVMFKFCMRKTTEMHSCTASHTHTCVIGFSLPHTEDNFFSASLTMWCALELVCRSIEMHRRQLDTAHIRMAELHISFCWLILFLVEHMMNVRLSEEKSCICEGCGKSFDGLGTFLDSEAQSKEGPPDAEGGGGALEKPAEPSMSS